MNGGKISSKFKGGKGQERRRRGKKLLLINAIIFVADMIWKAIIRIT